MKIKFFLLAASIASTATFATAAPQKPVANDLKTGVNITPITRNESESKIAFALAKNGKALAPIVISEKAGPLTKMAAEDMRKFLSQISGAQFKVETGDGESGIVIGSMEDFPVPALSKALEISHAFDGKEAYAIRTREKRVLLLGATDLAASHAVYRFLEELGCRWFFPDATGNWTIVPTIKDLKFNKEITDRPAFLSRTIWYSWGYFYDEGHPLGKDHSAGGDFSNWQLRNHMSESFKVNAGHAYDGIVAANAAVFEKHPEYYALYDGKRQGNQLEVSNPAVRQLIVDYAIKFFKDNPKENMVSVDPADGAAFSQSDEAKAYGSPGDGAFRVANQVAVALEKEFPGQNKMVGMYAYNWHSDPPAFELEPNVYILLTTAFNAGKLNFGQLMEEWPKKAKNLGFYDYYSTWRWDYDMWPGGRAGNKNYIVDMIGLFYKANAQSKAYATTISAESSGNWGVNGRGYYLANALMWNPDLDPEAILDDFYEKAFGPAAAEMKDYFSVQDAPPPASEGVTGMLFRRLDAAAKAAKGDAAVTRRINDIKNYLNYYGLSLRTNKETDAAKRAAMQQEVYERAYRTRYSYMNHWQAMLLDGIKYNAGDPAPWKVEEPLTPEETESLFQENLAYFPDLKIPTQMTFSKNNVVANLGGEPVAFQSPSYAAAGTGAGSRILLHSNGTPLKLHIKTAWGNGRNEAAYEVLDPSGKKIASGAPAHAIEFDLNVPVKAPGFYELRYYDANNLWNYLASPDQTTAVQLGYGTDLNAYSNNTPPMYFYVPKGTKSIEYYFTRTPYGVTGPHDVVAPDGTIVKTLDVSGAYISVPVPPGMDGKAWHFASPEGGGAGWGLGQYNFFNVPNILSTSPARMVLPEDVVKKDGLKIVK